MSRKTPGHAAKGPRSGKGSRETDPSLLRQAMLRRVVRRSSAAGSLVLPAAPAMLDHYASMLDAIFRALGRGFSSDELAHVRRILEEKLGEAFAASPHGSIEVRYETNPAPATSLGYTIAARVSTMEEQFTEWVSTRSPPLFGDNPDARVLAAAAELGPPAEAPVLDVGAGTGRNAFALARLGFPVDATEKTPAFCEAMRAEALRERLAVRVFEADIVAPETRLEPRYRLILLSEVVSHFRPPGDLRALFERAAEGLLPGGLLLFNVFMSIEAHTPDRMARELSQVFWSSAFTYKELAVAAEGLPLERVSDEPVLEFERANLPEGAWPPTGWYAEWVSGQDIYDLPEGRPPVDMRWMLYRRA